MKLASVILAMMLSVSTAAYAHPDHEDEPPQTIKLHATKSVDGVKVDVIDQGKKVSTAGASGRLVWFKGATKGEAALLPSGDNSMLAKGAKLPAGTKTQATITFADKTVFTGDVAVK